MTRFSLSCVILISLIAFVVGWGVWRRWEGNSGKGKQKTVKHQCLTICEAHGWNMLIPVLFVFLEWRSWFWLRTSFLFLCIHYFLGSHMFCFLWFQAGNFHTILPEVRQKIIDGFTPEARDLFDREFAFFDAVTSISGVLFPLPKEERRAGIRRYLYKSSSCNQPLWYVKLKIYIVGFILCIGNLRRLLFKGTTCIYRLQQIKLSEEFNWTVVSPFSQLRKFL